MDALPVEILHILAGYLRTSDVSTFRLLTRNCAIVGLEYLCPIVSVILTSPSLERFQQISEHPLLSKNVHTVSFLPLLLPEPLELSVRDAESIKKEQLWDWYLAERLRWEDWPTKVASIDKLGRTLSKFPGLHALLLPRRDPITDNSFKFKLGSMKRGDLLQDGQGDRFVFHVLESAVRNCPMLNRLEICFEGDGTVYPYYDRRDWPKLLKRIEHLSWDYPIMSAPAEMELSNPRPLFLVPRHLRSMKIGWLSFGVHGDDPDVFYSFLEIVHGNHFPNLEELSLEAMFIEERHFPKFLERHSSSLRHLVLRSIGVQWKDLPSFLELLAASGLDSLILDGMLWHGVVWGEEHYENYNDYYLRAIIVEGKGLPRVGKLISSVVLGLWRFVDDEYKVIACRREEGAIETLRPRLLRILLRWGELRGSLYFGEMATYDGYILFKEDVLFEQLERYETRLKDIDALPDMALDPFD